MTTKVWFVVRLAVALSVLGSAIGGATMPGFAQDSLPPQPSSEPDAGVASLIPAGEPVEQSASRSVGGQSFSPQRRFPISIDFQTALVAKLEGLPDRGVLAIAAQEGRILISHDQRTMPLHFADFITTQRLFVNKD
ncbi:MAG: hypothetical protein IGS54_29970 [Elainella sp. C42_A2020_010]|nr:hypothetical protein [Elainella sp. C42_A2020_010]